MSAHSGRRASGVELHIRAEYPPLARSSFEVRLCPPKARCTPAPASPPRAKSSAGPRRLRPCPPKARCAPTPASRPEAKSTAGPGQPDLALRKRAVHPPQRAGQGQSPQLGPGGPDLALRKRTVHPPQRAGQRQSRRPDPGGFAPRTCARAPQAVGTVRLAARSMRTPRANCCTTSPTAKPTM
jgi:hypothetical protein